MQFIFIYTFFSFYVSISVHLLHAIPSFFVSEKKKIGYCHASVNFDVKIASGLFASCLTAGIVNLRKDKERKLAAGTIRKMLQLSPG